MEDFEKAEGEAPVGTAGKKVPVKGKTKVYQATRYFKTGAELKKEKEKVYPERFHTPPKPKGEEKLDYGKEPHVVHIDPSEFKGEAKPKSTEAGQLKEPYGEKDLEHERMRMRTMNDRALMARIHKITDPNKLLNFFSAAKNAGKEDLADAIQAAGKDLGLNPRDFGGVESREKTEKEGEKPDEPLTEQEIKQLKEFKGTDEEIEQLKNNPSMARHIIKFGEEKAKKEEPDEPRIREGKEFAEKERQAEVAASERKSKAEEKKPSAEKKPEEKPAEKKTFEEGVKAGDRGALIPLKEKPEKPVEKKGFEEGVKETEKKTLPAKGEKLQAKEKKKKPEPQKAEEVIPDESGQKKFHMVLEDYFNTQEQVTGFYKRIEALKGHAELDMQEIRPIMAQFQNLAKEEDKFKAIFTESGIEVHYNNYTRKTERFKELYERAFSYLNDVQKQTLRQAEDELKTITVMEKLEKKPMEKAIVGLLDLLVKAGKLPPPKDEKTNGKQSLSHRKTVHEYFGDDKAEAQDNKSNILLDDMGQTNGQATAGQTNGQTNGNTQINGQTDHDPHRGLVENLNKLVALKQRGIALLKHFYEETSNGEEGEAREEPKEAEKEVKKAILDILKARFVDLVKATVQVKAHQMKTKYGSALRRGHQRKTSDADMVRWKARQIRLDSIRGHVRDGNVVLSTAFGPYKVEGYRDDDGWVTAVPVGGGSPRSFMVTLEDLESSVKRPVAEAPALHYGESGKQWEVMKDLLKEKVRRGELKGIRDITNERLRLQKLDPDELEKERVSLLTPHEIPKHMEIPEGTSDAEIKMWAGQAKEAYVPKELAGLWKFQYAPREKLILGSMSPETRKKWDSFSLSKKIAVIDNLQAKGTFGAESKKEAYGESSGAWHSRTMEKMKTLDEESLRFIIKDATEAAENAEKMETGVGIVSPKAGQYRDEVHYAFMELERRKKGGKQKKQLSEAKKDSVIQDWMREGQQ